jgi:hypothetical protein
MATTPTSPIDPSASENVRNVAKAMLEIQKTQESIGDLASQMVESYKKILLQVSRYGVTMNAITKKHGKIASFSKAILEDARARSMIQDEISSQLRSQEIAMVKYKFYEQEAARSGIARLDALYKEEEIQKKLAENSSLSHRDKLKYIEEEFKRTKVNTDYLSDQAQITESAKQTAVGESIKKFREMTDEQLKNSKEFKTFVEQGKDYFKNIEDTAMRRAETESETADAAERSLNAIYSSRKYLEDTLRLNRMIQTSVKMQAGLTQNIKENNFAAFGPLAGAARNSNALVTSLKQAGFYATLAEVSLVAMEKTLTSIVKLYQMGFERFKYLDKAAEDFRKETGFTKDQMVRVRDLSENLNSLLAEMGATMEEFYSTTKAITDTFGTIGSVSEKALIDITAMKVNLGVAAEDSAAVLSTFQGLGGLTEKSALNVMSMTARLSTDAGVSFKMVMKDVANASDDVLTSLGANPQRLMKAAVAARQLGLDLNKVGSQQKRLLDFTSSMTDELEASALLGRNITFMRARQLAFEGKSEESMKETLNVVRQMGDFNRMTPYQRAAIAKAAGMELKDLTKALGVEKARLDIMNGSDEAAKARYRLQEAALDKMGKEEELTVEMLLKDRERAIMQKQMQGVMTNLTNTMMKLGIALANIFKPVFVLIEEITPALEWIANRMGKLADGMKDLGAAGGLIIGGIMAAVAYVSFTVPASLLSKAAGKLTDELSKVTVKAAYKLGEKVGSAVAESMGSSIAKKGVDTVKDSVAGKAPDAAKTITDAASKTEKVGRGANYGGGIKVFLRNFTDGLSYFGRPSVMKGYLGIALMGASLLPFIGSMYLFTQIDWAKAVDGIEALAIVSIIAGIIGLAAPLLIKGSIALGILGIALIPLGMSFELIGDAAERFGKGINLAKDGIVEILKNAEPANIAALGLLGLSIIGLALALNVAAPVLAVAGAGVLLFTAGVIGLAYAIATIAPHAEKFGKGMSAGVSALKTLAKIKFIDLAANMKQLNELLKSSNEGMFGFINSMFGKDAFDKIKELSAISSQLLISSQAIASLVQSFQNLNPANNFAAAIDKVTQAFKNLNSEVGKMDKVAFENATKLGGIVSANNAVTTTATTSTTTLDSDKIVQKLDDVIKAISNMTVEMDKDKVGKILAPVIAKVAAPSGT